MTDLFNGTPPTEETAEQVLARMKDKYGDEAKIAMAKEHADRHITRLEAENAGMREDLSKRKTIEEFYAEIKRGAPQPNTPPQSEERNELPVQSNDSYKPEDVEAIVSKALSKKEQEVKARNNVAYVAQELTKAWGPNYAERLQGMPSKLGVSQEYLEKMAVESPQMFLLAVVGQQSPNPAPNVTPPKSSVSFASNNANSNVRNYAYFEKLRKEDNANYWSRKVQNEMHQAAMQMGEDFYKS